MVRILFTLFILLITAVPVGVLAAFIYSLSPYRHAALFRFYSRGERAGLYFIAIYPMASLITLILISNYLYTPEVHDSTHTAAHVIFFGGQTILGAWGVAVAWYLRMRSRLNNVFVITSLLAGACYLTMISWMYILH